MWREVVEASDRLWAWWPFWLIFGLTRLTQIVLFDRILDAPRRAWLRLVNPKDYPPGDDRLNLLAYVSMCIFCMSVEIGLIIGVLWVVPYARDLVPIVMTILGASFFVPLLDHWQDKAMDDKTLSPEAIKAWSHGGADVKIEVDAKQIEPEGD